MFMLQKVENRIQFLKQMTETWTGIHSIILANRQQWCSQEGPFSEGHPVRHFPDY